jgi:integrase
MGKRRGHGEGAIYQRESDGKWCATVDLGWVGGKRKRKVIYGETRKEVADKLKALHREQAAGALVASDRQTVGQYLDRWLETSVKPNRRAKTADIYARLVRLYLKPHLGKIQLTKLEPAHVQTMLNTLLTSGAADGGPLSPRTIHHVRAVLRRALNQAVRWGYVTRNAAALAETPRVERRPATVLTAEQGQHLLAAVAGHQWEALYVLALLLGLREGELIGLRWVDVDLDQRTLRVEQTVQRIGKQLVIAAPKTAGSRRLLPLPAAAVRALREHATRQAQRHEVVGDDWKDHGLVFPTGVGTPVEPRNLVRHFKQALKKAELPDVRFHDLRHSCATMLIAQGVHPRTVMEILGHSQISVTMNTYGHVLPDTQRAAADAMDRLFQQRTNGSATSGTGESLQAGSAGTTDGESWGDSARADREPSRSDDDNSADAPLVT